MFSLTRSCGMGLCRLSLMRRCTAPAVPVPGTRNRFGVLVLGHFEGRQELVERLASLRFRPRRRPELDIPGPTVANDRYLHDPPLTVHVAAMRPEEEGWSSGHGQRLDLLGGARPLAEACGRLLQPAVGRCARIDAVEPRDMHFAGDR